MYKHTLGALLTCLLTACGGGGSKNPDDSPGEMPTDGGEGGKGASQNGGTSQNGGSGPSSETPADVMATLPPEIGNIGELPAPLAVSSSVDSTKLAASLVGTTRSWSSDALPAFETALLLAGYTIHHGDVVLFEPETPNGIAIQAWDVQAAKGLLDRGLSISLKELSGALNGALEGIELDVTGSIIDAVGAAKSSGVPTLEFWADLLTEFGRRADSPHDFATLGPDADVQLSPPEVLLIFTRMAADLYAYAPAEESRLTSAPRGSGAERSGKIGRAAWAATDASAPCQLSEQEQFLLDANAAGMGKAFDLLTDAVGENFAGVAQYAKVVSFANLLGAYVKLVWTFLAFDAKVQFTQEPQSLTRTKTSTPGERKTLQVAATFSTKNSQVLNCVRPALNALGLDFSLPSDGPIREARVQWKLLTGGTVGGRSATTGYLQFVGSDPLNGKTDSDGIATIDLEGAPQRVTLKDGAKQLKRRGKVWVGLIIKPANLYQDFVDAAGVGILPSFTGLLTTPAEMLYRTSEVFGTSWAFPVIDWSMGTLYWAETGTLRDTQHSMSVSGSSTTTAIDVEYHDIRTYEVETANVYSLLGKLNGVISLQASELSLTENVRWSRYGTDACADGTEQCDREIGNSWELELQGSSPLTFPMILQVQGEGASRYSIDVALAGYSVTGMGEKRSWSTEPQGPYDRTTSESVTEPTRSDMLSLTGVYEGAFQGHKEYSSTMEPIIRGPMSGTAPKVQTTIVIDWDFAIPVQHP